MIATAVASRGLDIRGVNHVINYDMCNDIDEFVHRIGRTARVGNNGLATSFYNDKHEGIAPQLTKILQECNQEIPDFLQSYVSEYTYVLLSVIMASYEEGNDAYSTLFCFLFSTIGLTRLMTSLTSLSRTEIGGKVPTLAMQTNTMVPGVATLAQLGATEVAGKDSSSLVLMGKPW